jgi:N-acetylmuramoyl-L-alanine amidase
MRRAVLAFLFCSAFAGATAAADLASTRIGDSDYVRLDDGAAFLGLKIERLSPQAVLLKDGTRPVARLTDHSREIDLNGLRVFLGEQIVERSGTFYVSRIDFDDRLEPRLRPDLIGTPPHIPRIIAIDPGHGGTDNGTSNPELGTVEKTYTLDVSLRLKRLLEAGGYTVVITRDSDYDVPKAVRAEIANRANADILVSVHFNALVHNRKTTGVETLSFPPRTQRSTNAWSPGEKDDSERAGSPVNSFDPWNTVLAGAIHRRVLDAMHAGDRGEKLEHLGVLRGLKCPGALVEPAFLTSDLEGARLASEPYRDTIAAAIFAGIQDYAAIIRSLHPPAAQATAPKGPAARPAATQAPAGAAPRSEPTRPSGP